MSLVEFRNNVVRALAMCPRVQSVMYDLDRGLFSQSPLAYSWTSPAPILESHGINMTAANLHAEGLKVIYEHFQSTSTQPSSALDVGTGTGYIATVLSQLFPSLERILGIDVHEALISKARSIHEAQKFAKCIEYKLMNVYDLPDGEMFDVIHGGATVHGRLGDILGHLKAGGIMLMPYSLPDKSEVFGVWRKDAQGNVSGPTNLSHVRYTPMVLPT